METLSLITILCLCLALIIITISLSNDRYNKQKQVDKLLQALKPNLIVADLTEEAKDRIISDVYIPKDSKEI